MPQLKRKIRCFRCDGKGTYKDIDPFAAVVTMGLSLLIELGENHCCPECEGRGWIYEYDEED